MSHICNCTCCGFGKNKVGRPRKEKHARVNCEDCGVSYTYTNRTNHEKTKKHIEIAEKISVLKGFLLNFTTKGKIQSTELFNEYCVWCELQDKDSLSIRDFGFQMGKMEHIKKIKSGNVYYVFD